MEPPAQSRGTFAALYEPKPQPRIVKIDDVMRAFDCNQGMLIPSGNNNHEDESVSTVDISSGRYIYSDIDSSIDDQDSVSIGSDSDESTSSTGSIASQIDGNGGNSKGVVKDKRAHSKKVPMNSSKIIKVKQASEIGDTSSLNDLYDIDDSAPDTDTEVKQKSRKKPSNKGKATQKTRRVKSDNTRREKAPKSSNQRRPRPVGRSLSAKRSGDLTRRLAPHLKSGAGLQHRQENNSLSRSTTSTHVQRPDNSRGGPAIARASTGRIKAPTDHERMAIRRRRVLNHSPGPDSRQQRHSRSRGSSHSPKSILNVSPHSQSVSPHGRAGGRQRKSYRSLAKNQFAQAMDNIAGDLDDGSDSDSNSENEFAEAAPEEHTVIVEENHCAEKKGNRAMLAKLATKAVTKSGKLAKTAAKTTGKVANKSGKLAKTAVKTTGKLVANKSGKMAKTGFDALMGKAEPNIAAIEAGLDAATGITEPDIATSAIESQEFDVNDTDADIIVTAESGVTSKAA